MGEGDDRTEMGSEGGEGDMDMDLEAALNREEDEGATDEEDEDEEVSLVEYSTLLDESQLTRNNG